MVGLPFLKKKEPEIIVGRGFVPIDRVKEMASRGFSEPEMIDVLRREGFSAEEIDRALTQALKIGVTGEAKPTPPKAEEPKLPTLEEIVPPPQAPQIPETSLPPEYSAPSYTTEDYIDYVVQSRVSEIHEKVNEFGIKYQELDKRIGQINEQLSEIIKSRASEQQALINKIDSFKENIEDTNLRLAGLEKAFKETLPALIESVRALSDLVQRLKREA
jgi:hypothetical protein